MKKSEYTTWESFPRKIKVMIYNHLFSCSMIKADSDKANNTKLMENFHLDLCINNRLWPGDYDMEGMYGLFFEWLATGDHNEQVFNIYTHLRAFKSFVEVKAKPSSSQYTSHEPVKIGPVNEMGRRLLALSPDNCRKVMRTMEEMDAQAPGPGSIGASLKQGKRWTEFNFYKDAAYTLEAKSKKSVPA